VAIRFDENPDMPRHRLLKVWSILFEKALVVSHFLLGANQERKILGHEAGLDGVDATFSSVARICPALVASSLPMRQPRVQAKNRGIELVEVSRPF